MTELQELDLRIAQHRWPEARVSTTGGLVWIQDDAGAYSRWSPTTDWRDTGVLIDEKECGVVFLCDNMWGAGPSGDVLDLSNGCEHPSVFFEVDARVAIARAWLFNEEAKDG